jgi:hypothetical protein
MSKYGREYCGKNSQRAGFALVAKYPRGGEFSAAVHQCCRSMGCRSCGCFKAASRFPLSELLRIFIVRNEEIIGQKIRSISYVPHYSLK